MYDFSMDVWTTLEPMQMGRSGHGCGLIEHENGTQEVMVAGGQNTSTVEMYNLESGIWR